MSKKSSKQSLLNRVFRAKQPTHRVEIPKENPVPRTTEAINASYSSLCTTIGDRQVKLKGLQMELDTLYKHVEQLGNELAAREELDKSQKTQEPTPEQTTAAPVVTPSAEAKNAEM